MKQLSKSYHVSLVLALAMLGATLFGGWSASGLSAAQAATNQGSPVGDQVTSGTIVVTPSNLAGWRLMEEDPSAGRAAGGMLVRAYPNKPAARKAMRAQAK